MGVTGKGVVSFLKKHKAHFLAWDDHNLEADYVSPEKAPWHNIDICILSPGISFEHPLHPAIIYAQKHNVEIITDIELYARLTKIKQHIGVTGTVGKSTAVSFISHHYNRAGITSQPCGNFGIPILDIIENTQLPVIELSSAQLAITSKPFLDVAIITSFFPDHLDFHGTFARYLKAKKRIERLLNPDGLMIVWMDYMDEIDFLEWQNTIYISSNPEDEKAHIIIEKSGFVEKKSGIRQQYNMPKHLTLKHSMRFLYATVFCINKHLNLTKTDPFIQESLNTFKNLEHRCEYVGSWENVTCVNDSKASNTEATCHALNTFRNIIWLAGGRRKSPFEISNSLSTAMNNVRCGYFFGEDAQIFSSALQDKIPQTKQCENLENAVMHAIAFARAHPTESFYIVLSPAATSFDQFPNFTERGRMFKKALYEYFHQEAL